MEELLIKIGEMLDEKIVEVKQEIVGTEKRLREEIVNLEDKLKKEIVHSEEKLREEIINSEEKLRKEMLDRYFLFEQEYGDKIISMGDYILLDKDKNEIRNNQVDQLENRVERLEVKSLVYENDIFKLQHSRKQRVQK